LELIGTENVKLSTKEMNMIAQLVIKEEEMEIMEKMNKVQKLDQDVGEAQSPKIMTSTEKSSKKPVISIVDSSKIVSDTKIPPIPPTSTPKSEDSKKL